MHVKSCEISGPYNFRTLVKSNTSSVWNWNCGPCLVGKLKYGGLCPLWLPQWLRLWKKTKTTLSWLLSILRGVFRTQSNIYNGAFLREPLTIFEKNSIINVWLGSKYVSNNFVDSIFIYGLLHYFGLLRNPKITYDLPNVLIRCHYSFIHYSLGDIIYWNC